MRTVHKYPIDLTDQEALTLPLGARPLHVALQYGEVKLWALVDPDAPQWRHRVLVVGTGHEMEGLDEAMDRAEHLNTFLVPTGAQTLVFHAFDLGQVPVGMPEEAMAS